jgi:sirohydrochlorin cobaltochelatase
MRGYLLFSHGSLLCGAGQALSEHAARLRERFSGEPVEIGYLNYSEPSIMIGVERLVAAGATDIVVVPYFLVPGYFVTRGLPDALEPIKARFPAIDFIVADTLGSDEKLADALIESAQCAGSDPEQWRDVYDEAAANCRDRADCPIYGTPNCPLTSELLEPLADHNDSIAR